jgi:hypothetical protein
MDTKTTDPTPTETPEPTTATPASTPDGELSNDDLNKASGGSRLQQAHHDMKKSIVDNFRA